MCTIPCSSYLAFCSLSLALPTKAPPPTPIPQQLVRKTNKTTTTTTTTTMKLMLTAGLVITSMAAMAISSESSVLQKVGSRKGWIPNFNYTDWSAQHHFYVGDWLLFVFEKRYYNVLEVNETSYDVCEERGFIRNVTKGGRDVVELTEERIYYFISGGGYCWGGMKVAVDVEVPISAAAPAPGSDKVHANHAAALSANCCHQLAGASCMISTIVVIIVLLVFVVSSD